MMLRRITPNIAYFAGWIVGASMVLSSSTLVLGQCSIGGCGNSSVADGAGGFGSVPYAANRNGMGYGTNGGYGTWGHRQVQPLFDNYFTQGNANQADAALYIAPTGVPGWVGHTYVTYQPLYPHQFLYQHEDRYHSYYDQGKGLNRTKATYWAPPIHTAAQKVYHMFELPR
jgi:hypothetical protein